MDTNQTTESTVAVSGYIFKSGDGKGTIVPDGQRLVKISEKKVGKGKGKTIASILIPKIDRFSSEEFNLLTPILADAVQGLQNEILVRMQRAGAKATSEVDIGIVAVCAEFAAREFGEIAIQRWFDDEVSEYLAALICHSRGFPESEVERTEAQNKLVNERIAAYRITYSEVGKRMPVLSPDQIKELIRVMDLIECTGPVAERIREKISPKPSVAATLGF